MDATEAILLAFVAGGLFLWWRGGGPPPAYAGVPSSVAAGSFIHSDNGAGAAGITAGTQLATGNFVGAGMTTLRVFSNPQVQKATGNAVLGAASQAAHTLSFGLL